MKSNSSENKKVYNDAFHAMCPYFAMFPPEFARDAIKKYSKKGDLVIDPFSGRGTTLLEARILGRNAIANDINPVAVTITRSKTSPLNLEKCILQIEKLREDYTRSSSKELKSEAKKLPPFFHHAFHPSTLLQVLWLKRKLNRVSSPEKIFIKTLCIAYLHGETQKTKLVYMSNNLPHTYCPKPEYSVNFWKDRGMLAPNVDAFDILVDRCKFRLQNSIQEELKEKGLCIQGDARKFGNNIKKFTQKKAKLVVTSPPYLKITSYEEDQWLRLWFLGGTPYPSRGKITKDDQIVSQEKYIKFLGECWKSIAPILKDDGVIVCRIGQSSKDKFPLREIVQKSLDESGYRFKITKESFSPFKNNRQAIMFNGGNYGKSGEYDFVIKLQS